MKHTVVIQYTVPAKCYSRKTKDISKNILNYVAKDPKYITQTLKNNHKKINSSCKTETQTLLPEFLLQNHQMQGLSLPE